MIHSNPSERVILPSLRCIGIVITGNDYETQMAVDAGVIPELGNLLISHETTIRKETAWALSNITAGTTNQVQTVIDSKVMSILIKLAKDDTFEVRRECIWCLSNTTSNATVEQLQQLIQDGIVEALCNILSNNDPRTLAIALEGIENILRKTKEKLGEASSDEIALRIEKCGGLNLLENLESHTNTHIYNKVVKIIEDFFETEDNCTNEESLRPISIFDF